MKYHLVRLILIASLVMGAFSAILNAQDEDYDTSGTITTEDGLTVHYPPGWYATTDYRMVMLANSRELLDLAVSGGDFPQLTGDQVVGVVFLTARDELDFLDLPDRADLAMILDRFVTTMMDADEMRLGSAENITIDNRAAAIVSGTVTLDEITNDVAMILVKLQGEYVLNVLMTGKGARGRHLPAIQAIAVSVQLGSDAIPYATPSPVPEPVVYPAPVQHNQDWEPFIDSFDGVEMVLVPPGCFTMGSTDDQIDVVLELCELVYGDCEREIYEIEQPAHVQCFDEPFWIDRYEVTNAQFAAFGGVAAYEVNWTDDDLPREWVSWFEAGQFCAERGGRLPTEAEWEYAARGPDGLVYPWGDDFETGRANLCDQNCDWVWRDENVDDGYPFTAPVGSFPGDVSWVGAYDMGGNVSEWTSTIYDQDAYPYPYDGKDGRERYLDDGDVHRVHRGSAFGGSSVTARAAYRTSDVPNVRAQDTGIRCVREYLE